MLRDGFRAFRPDRMEGIIFGDPFKPERGKELVDFLRLSDAEHRK